MSTLAEDARALMAATAHVAGDKVGEARRRLAAGLEHGRDFYGRVREKAVEGVKAADQTVRENPYAQAAAGTALRSRIPRLVLDRLRQVRRRNCPGTFIECQNHKHLPRSHP